METVNDKLKNIAQISIGVLLFSGQDYYYLIAPSVNRAALKLSNGNTLVIKANASAKNIYIASVKLNGKTINKATITHSLLSNGAVLDFRLTDKPTTKWIK